MNFKIGEVNDQNENCDKSQKWHIIKEFDFILTQLIGMPIGLVLTEILHFYVINLTFIKSINFNIKDILLSFLVILSMHELMHVSIFPNLNKVTLGINFKKIITYSLYDDEINRNTLILSLSFPFIVLSIIPMIIVSFVHINSNFLGLVILINAVASYNDIYNIFVLLLQVPPIANVRISGEFTYWKWPEK